MMAETGIGAWLIGKIAPTIAALFGGLSLVLFWTPDKLLEKGRIVSIFIAGALSATFGFAFTGVVAMALGVSMQQLDQVVGLAWLLGFGSVAIFNWAANFISNRANSDILEVYEEIKGARATPAKKAAKPVAVKPKAVKTPTRTTRKPK